jgi:hypothetical protein
MKYLYLLPLLTACGGPERHTTRSIPGTPGQDAEPCVVTQDASGTTVTCPASSVFIPKAKDGETVIGPAGKDGESIQGPKGDSGESIIGPRGEAGRDGVDATPVEMIQLCPNLTPTYPSTFVESAICVDNKLYGVYSSPAAFLAELPPGVYVSNGINATCTFTVKENCEIAY